MIRSETTKKVARLAMLSGLSIVFMLLLRFPLMAPYLEYTPAEIPILIASFLYGPWYGVGVSLVVAVIQGLTVSANSGIIGIVMNFAMSSAMCMTAGLIYKHGRTMKNAIFGLVFGGIATILIALPLNVLLTPVFMPFLSMRDVAALIIPVILPFNAIKVSINAIVTLLVYKPISRLFALQGKKKQSRDADTPQ